MNQDGQGKLRPIILALIKKGGFTLIELLVVVAIVAVLVSIAVPAYSDYVTNAKLSETLGVLTEMKVNMIGVMSKKKDCEQDLVKLSRGVTQSPYIMSINVTKKEHPLTCTICAKISPSVGLSKNKDKVCIKITQTSEGEYQSSCKSKDGTTLDSRYRLIDCKE